MSLTMFESTVPVLWRGLCVLLSYVDRIGEAHAAGKADAREVLSARLAPDMFNLGKQIQIACDNAKGGPARLTGRAAPVFADDEETLEDFRNRILKTRAYLQTFRASHFEGSEDLAIDQSFRHADYAMPGVDFLRAVLLPNFYFHIAMVHGILRHLGFQVGKADYFGKFQPNDVTEAFSPWVPVRFLTAGESGAWQELNAAPQPHRFQFETRAATGTSRELVDGLMEDMGSFDGGLLRLTDWIWDDEYESDPTQPYREQYGEDRPLLEVPGFLFGPEGKGIAAELLSLVIDRRWSARFQLRAGAATLEIHGGDRFVVCGRDEETTRRVEFRLIETGVGAPA
jgi:hypothetical protein